LKEFIATFTLLASLFTFSCVELLAYENSAGDCANCHSQVSRQWQSSGHANGLKTLLKEPDSNWTCLKCHSADYRRIRKLVRDTIWRSVSDMPTPKSASHPVYCSSCHRPDSSLESNLIRPADKLCTPCHILYCGG